MNIVKHCIYLSSHYVSGLGSRMVYYSYLSDEFATNHPNALDLIDCATYSPIEWVFLDDNCNKVILLTICLSIFCKS